MTNAMKLAIDFGLYKIELNRIMAITNKQNQSAIKLLDRLNFIKVDDLLNEEVKYEFKSQLKSK
jgi:ribosomal-protein-alanine N-acetyltransferase